LATVHQQIRPIFWSYQGQYAIRHNRIDQNKTRIHREQNTDHKSVQ
jgi:hypothetical protein